MEELGDGLARERRRRALELAAEAKDEAPVIHPNMERRFHDTVQALIATLNRNNGKG